MSLVAPTLEAFFTERLLVQRQASPHTVASYRDCWKLLLAYVQETTGTPPSKLDFSDLDAKRIGAFLDHLERERGLSARSRNVRLSAIRSFFSFAALWHPEHAETIRRVLAIPAKRGERTLVDFLVPAEVDALLAAPDRSRRIGRRDHALLVLAVQTGLRVSELAALRIEDVHLGTGAYVHCVGKGRRERASPRRPSPCWGTTLQSALARGASRCSSDPPAARSDATRSAVLSSAMRRPQRTPARRSQRNGQARIRSGTPARCACSRPARTSRPLPYGWAIRPRGRPRSTFTPTSH